MTVRGHPRWNIGHRLLTRDERGDWEAYIEGVAHQYDMRTGQYLTQLRITRGWYLSATIAGQMAEEGQIPVTDVRGGPQTLDPATGQPVKEVKVFFPGIPGFEPPPEERVGGGDGGAPLTFKLHLDVVPPR